MIAIGNVKLGVRIEPIYMQELSREEANAILQNHGIHFEENVYYPIDTRIINIFRTDKQKLSEYIQACKYVYERRLNKNAQKPDTTNFSIFDDNLQINFELKDVKESDAISNEDKVKIYRRAKELQSMFKMFGAKNVNLGITIIDRAYFEVQNFIQTIQSRKSTPSLPEGTNKNTFRRDLYSKEAQRASDEVIEKWNNQIEKSTIQEKDEMSKI